MKKYKGIYKCKLCGGTYTTVYGKKFISEIEETKQHKCQQDGAVGLLELVGYTTEEDYPVTDFIGF